MQSFMWYCQPLPCFVFRNYLFGKFCGLRTSIFADWYCISFNIDNVVANKWASSYMRQSADNMFTFSVDRVGGVSDLADVWNFRPRSMQAAQHKDETVYNWRQWRCSARWLPRLHKTQVWHGHNRAQYLAGSTMFVCSTQRWSLP